MSLPYPSLYPAPAWPGSMSKTCSLYHGCTRRDADDIIKHGINLQKCRLDADFGQGFYLTTHQRQARMWAWYRFYGVPLAERGTNPAVVLRFDLSRDDLADLESLVFVRGDFHFDDVWSLIHHFRQGASVTGHHRPSSTSTWYDTVWGPVSVLWQQRNAMVDADQVSFHSKRAVKLLQKAVDDDQTHIETVQ